MARGWAAVWGEGRGSRATATGWLAALCLHAHATQARSAAARATRTCRPGGGAHLGLLDLGHPPELRDQQARHLFGLHGRARLRQGLPQVVAQVGVRFQEDFGKELAEIREGGEGHSGASSDGRLRGMAGGGEPRSTGRWGSPQSPAELIPFIRCYPCGKAFFNKDEGDEGDEKPRFCGIPGLICFCVQ